MNTFKQYLIEAAYSSGEQTLKTINVQGTYRDNDGEEKRGAWRGIRMFQTGRGWHSEVIVILLNPEPIVVKVTNNKYGPEGKYVQAQIISGGEQPVLYFAKRPYTSKKTGKQNPNVITNHVQPLKKVYGVRNGEIAVRKMDLQ